MQCLEQHFAEMIAAATYGQRRLPSLSRALAPDLLTNGSFGQNGLWLTAGETFAVNQPRVIP